MAVKTYGGHLDLAKNQLQNAVIHSLGSAPGSPVEGQVYYDTTAHKKFVYNGTIWVPETGAIPAGGSIGQIVTKKSATDYDAEWANGAPLPWDILDTFKIANMPRGMAASPTITLTSGTVYLYLHPVWPGMTLDKIRMYTGSTGGTAFTHSQAALVAYSDLTRVGITNDDTANIGTNTGRTWTLTSTYTVPASVYKIYVALLLVATTTVPTMRGMNWTSATPLASEAPVLSTLTTATGQTAIGAGPFTLGAGTSSFPYITLG